MSWLLKAPPQIDSGSHQNFRTDVFGNVTYEPGHAKQVLNPRARESYRTPGYASLKDKNLLPIQQFNCDTSVKTDVGGVATKLSSFYSGGMTHWRTLTRSGSTQYNCGAAWLGLDGAPALTADADAKRQAESRALSQCANMKMNLAQSFAERKQTSNLLINNVNRFVAFAAAARKGSFVEANKLLKGRFLDLTAKDNPAKFRRNYYRRPTQDDFSNLWLEYSYGWRPLLADIYGAAELLAQTAMKSRPMSVLGRGKSYQLDRWKYNGNVYQGAADVYRESWVECNTAFYFDIADSGLDVLKQTGITNPALLAWELLPYSFVVDWFIPVGTYLQNWGATHGLRFVKGWQSVKTKQITVSTPTRCYDGFTVAGVGPCTMKRVALKRVPLFAFPNPELPRFNMDLNLKQLASATALLHQIFRR